MPDAPKPLLNPTRRQFCRLAGLGGGALSLGLNWGRPGPASAQAVKRGLIGVKLSPYFTPLEAGQARCDLCPRLCRLAPGQRGLCRVRENRDGKIYSLVFGNPCGLYLDPVERNPFFHVLPGSASLSLTTAGCNFNCRFCQTWEISQASPEDVFGLDLPPEAVIARARQMGARSVAYTFVEPVIFIEYLIEVGRLARQAGLLSLVHSNGFINPGPLDDLCRAVDGANIDLKGFSQDYYREVCDGDLEPVLETLKALRRKNVHLEITNLVVPGKNDDPAAIREMSLWIKRELGPETPLHFLRFYPIYKLRNLPPTPVARLEAARAAALSAGLKYVYVGNVPGHEAENTFCPECKRRLIQRTGFMVGQVNLEGGRCRFCGASIPGLWS